MKPLTIRDEVHGDMVFDPLLRCVIDHSLFQRLRHIKQLGLAEYVFPCANHTRFQHSLGASYLAGQYFEKMMKTWTTTPFLFEGKAENTHFYAEKTRRCIESVSAHAESHLYWARVVSLAGLLHDVGHGPWSHTFEHLRLRKNFEPLLSQIHGPVGEYLREVPDLRHEELSLVYIHVILRDLEARHEVVAEDYFLPIASLVNRKLMEGARKAALESELSTLLTRKGVAGGVAFHRLLRPIISGPFDVDRMDYIQRDGRNSGVLIGGIEWRRIVSKLLPCLADHENDKGEPRDVVLVSHVKNQHVLDDFIFSLFQMYAQVYLHPKIVGFEEVISQVLDTAPEIEKSFEVTYDVHRSLTDEGFRNLLTSRFGLGKIESLLLRAADAQIEVASFTTPSGVDQELRDRNFTLIENLDRPMMKDSVGLFLYSSFGESTENFVVRPWTTVSPIAHQFYRINYSPQIWVRPEM